MAQTPGFDPTTQVKTCFDCKIFDVANWVACLNREKGPRGTPSHEALSVSSQGALKISSVAGQPPSLDRSHFSTPRLVAKSLKPDERCRPSSQRPQYPTLYRRLKCGGSLHKQTRRNSLSRDVCSPVEDHDLVPSLSHNIESQTHSRVSECDGQPFVQVEPSAVNRMVTASTGVQTDLPKVGHTSCRPICTHLNHKLPLYISPVPDPKAWDINALNINWMGLTAYAYPPMAFLHRVIQKIRQCYCLIIVIAPGWPGMPCFGDLV